MKKLLLAALLISSFVTTTYTAQVSIYDRLKTSVPIAFNAGGLLGSIAFNGYRLATYNKTKIKIAALPDPSPEVKNIIESVFREHGIDPKTISIKLDDAGTDIGMDGFTKTLFMSPDYHQKFYEVLTSADLADKRCYSGILRTAVAHEICHLKERHWLAAFTLLPLGYAVMLYAQIKYQSKPTHIALLAQVIMKIYRLLIRRIEEKRADNYAFATSKDPEDLLSFAADMTVYHQQACEIINKNTTLSIFKLFKRFRLYISEHPHPLDRAQAAKKAARALLEARQKA